MLFFGLLVLIIEIWWFISIGKWTTLSFIDGIKIGAGEFLHIRSGDWIYNPRVLVWLHSFLNWLPLSPTMICLGLLGFKAPLGKRKVVVDAKEDGNVLVR